MEKIKQAIILLLESRVTNYSQATIEAWYTILKEHDQESILRAIKHYIVTDEKSLNTAKIIEKAKDFRIEELRRQQQIQAESGIEQGQGNTEVWAKRFGILAEKIKGIGSE